MRALHGHHTGTHHQTEVFMQGKLSTEHGWLEWVCIAFWQLEETLFPRICKLNWCMREGAIVWNDGGGYKGRGGVRAIVRVGKGRYPTQEASLM